LPVYDLHTHSTYSDGTLRPAELIARAAEQGVDVLALTDHDSTEGLAEATAAAQQHGVRLINGVEISVTWSARTIHVVGLGIDAANPSLQNGLAGLREQRAERARKMAAKLEKAGIPDALNTVSVMAGTEAATRTHFARFLVECGAARDMQAAFKKWLGRKGKAYVSGEWTELENAVGWITDAGGQAVIAHPVRYKMTNTKLKALIDEFRHFGGGGIEVATSSHAMHERRKIAEIAGQNALLSSVGSDFHTPGNPRIELGQYLDLPAGCEPIWNTWRFD